MATKTATRLSEEQVEYLKLFQQANDNLHSTKCICGGRKFEEESFCKRCHNKLPGKMRANLWTSFRDGYVEHYQVAKEFLEKLKSGVTKKAI